MTAATVAGGPLGSGPGVDRSESAELLEFNARCKALTLAAGASLLLSREEPGLRADALALARDAELARERLPQLDLVREAALGVASLSEPGVDAGAALARIRAAHRELRTALGALVAPDYAPCGGRSPVKEENHV